MADIKISALPTATTPLTGAELVPIVQSGVTKQTTATAIFTAGVLPVVNGGTGTATPALVPGSNVTITGTWPNQTINSTGGGGSGTVTSVSVVSANGLAGTVANATTTPAITLSTSVTGVVKGNGTTLSAATAGTDYVAPGGALGTPSSGTLTNTTGLPLTTGVTGILPVANGGTATATPALVAGTNVTITGTWPNQTINSTSGGGSGTVTTVSVVTANGLAGTVANPTTTPAITLSTSVTGIVKGNGTTLSAASAGTDYVAPGGALGTPSSGTVTNLTGTASININGTVGATTPAAGTFTSQNDGQLAGLRNRIINGAMTIDQRNAGGAQTITAAAALAYTVDRFYAYSTGANVTGQQVAGSLQSQKRYRFTGAASVTAIGFGTRLEAVNTYDLNNKTVTISADIANSLLTTVTWTLFRATTTDDTFGTLAAPTVTSLGTGTFTVTSTVTNYNAQVTLPTAATTGLQLVFTVGAQTSGTWTIGNVQLELGSTATPFEQRPYGMELALCQRYCFNISPGTTVPSSPIAPGYFTSATNFRAMVPITTPMRAIPTVSASAATDLDAAGLGSTAFTLIRTSSSALMIDLTTSGGTTGQAAQMMFSSAATSTSYFRFNAEL